MSDSANQSNEISESSQSTKKEEKVPLLFLGNLAPDVKDYDLKSFFGKVGVVKYVHIPTSKHTGESKGVGYIQYDDVRTASKAIQELDGKKFQGRHIRVQFARPFSETERKREEKRKTQISKSNRRSSDIYSPEHQRHSSGIARRDYDIPRDQYDENLKAGNSAQLLSLRKPSSPPLLKTHRDVFDERDRDLLRDRDRDRYDRERIRERYRDYYDRDIIPYDAIDGDYERERGIYRNRARERERDIREKDLRDWDRIKSESRREPTILYESLPRVREYNREHDRAIHERFYDRPREYYDRDDYYDRERDRDRDYYHALYQERPPIQYEKEYDVQTFDPQQQAQIQAAVQQLPTLSPQLISRDYGRVRAAQLQLPPPPLPGYESRNFDEFEYYQRAQSTAQPTSTPTRLTQPSPAHYIDYDEQAALAKELPYDSLVQGAPPPLPAAPPLAAPQQLQTQQALTNIVPIDMRLQHVIDLGQPYDSISPINARAPINSIIPPPPPPPPLQPRTQTQQQPQQVPLPLPARLAATHGLHSQYDQQIDGQNQ